MSKKLKDLLSENITTMGGVVSRPAFTNLDMGFRTQKSTKLTNIVEDMYGDSKPKINVKEFVQEIGQYNSYGNEIYREGNLKELASRLSKLAETAKQHTLQETEDWFDKITVNRNMKELTGLSNQGSENTTLVINSSGVVGTRENAASSGSSGSSGTTTITNKVNNRVLTATGTATINGEANLSFDKVAAVIEEASSAQT